MAAGRVETGTDAVRGPPGLTLEGSRAPAPPERRLARAGRRVQLTSSGVGRVLGSGVGVGTPFFSALPFFHWFQVSCQ
ncbi:hypothetical protein Sme01_44620 [Sphaerisporangium melleum]|uniref:Uncharacterized protein n=1 Tax=Sphaerisporangium melleum TaxID=321316 RepID=A0A917QZZ2_9ACTN|nr:hypothetical protein GCM10007964_24490 [Sphaerisporangium melleum]GII71986.1 hypothetical protein Sme01_44620 [Sphaerisporangium melleum]